MDGQTRVPAGRRRSRKFLFGPSVLSCALADKNTKDQTGLALISLASGRNRRAHALILDWSQKSCKLQELNSRKQDPLSFSASRDPLFSKEEMCWKDTSTHLMTERREWGKTSKGSACVYVQCIRILFYMVVETEQLLPTDSIVLVFSNWQQLCQSRFHSIATVRKAKEPQTSVKNVHTHTHLYFLLIGELPRNITLPREFSFPWCPKPDPDPDSNLNLKTKSSPSNMSGGFEDQPKLAHFAKMSLLC